MSIHKYKMSRKDLQQDLENVWYNLETLQFDVEQDTASVQTIKKELEEILEDFRLIIFDELMEE